MTCPKVCSNQWRRSICNFFKLLSLSSFEIHKLHATHTAKSLRRRRCCSCCCTFFCDIIEKFLCALHSGSTAASAEWANDKVERIVGTCCHSHAPSAAARLLLLPLRACHLKVSPESEKLSQIAFKFAALECVPHASRTCKADLPYEIKIFYL